MDTRVRRQAALTAAPARSADATATEVVVPGVSGFQMTKLAQQGDSNTLDVDVVVPDLFVTGLYDVHGKAKIGFIKVNVKGKGPLKCVCRSVLVCRLPTEVGTTLLVFLSHPSGSPLRA